MIEQYKKIPTRSEMLKMTIPELRDMSLELRLKPQASKECMISAIQCHIRNVYNSGRLYYMFKVQSEEEKQKAKEATKKAQKEVEEKKQRKQEVIKEINELAKEIEE